MTDEQRILEAIDACRPGCNDLDQPELGDLALRIKEDPHVAKLYQRIQRLDAQIGVALEDVSLPVGLEERIFQRLAAPEASDRCIDAPPPVATTARRYLPAALIGAAAVVLIAAGIVLLRSRQQPVTAGNVLELAEQWSRHVDPQRWRDIDSAPASHPPSPRVLANRHGWQRCSTGTAGGNVVAYDLGGNDAPPAVLLVLRTVVAGLPGRPPASPPLWTQNRSLAAWQTGQLLYVLVIDGPRDRYRRFVDTRRPPLA